jgi:hypothetical protein
MRYSHLLWLILSLSPPLVAKQPDFPEPPNARVEIVGKNMAVGGRFMDIRQFYTRDRMDKVNDFYKRKWAKGENGSEPGYVETDANPPWHIITRVEEEHLMTVQVQRSDDGGSWGYLAISQLQQTPSTGDLSASIPRMPDSQVIHTMETRDVGQQGETLMLENNHSLTSNINYYRQYYFQRGWRSDMDEAIPAGKMHVLAFTNGRYKINIVLTGDHKKTNIVVNRVGHDIL